DDWGKPGDPVVSMHHLKQPSEEVGPLSVAIDFPTGGLSIESSRDPFTILQQAAKGLGAKEAATLLFGSQEPSRAEEAKARRKLQKLVEEGNATCKPGSTNGALKAPDRFFAVPFQGELDRCLHEHASSTQALRSVTSTHRARRARTTHICTSTHRARPARPLHEHVYGPL
ncbi:MAG: hypothetical protein WD178_02830, partial [Actinomycetota bacterium]